MSANAISLDTVHTHTHKLEQFNKCDYTKAIWDISKMLICVYPRIVRQSDTHTNWIEIPIFIKLNKKLTLLCKKTIEKLE